MHSAPPEPLRNSAPLLCAAAAIVLIAHFATGNGYGFFRDELQFLDDARHLDFGFVAYPPLTSLLGRASITLFGISPQTFRLPSAILNAASLLLTALTARELGGRRLAQLFAILAALPVALVLSSLFEYVTPDYLAWALLAFFTARLLRTADPRWWIAIGAAAGIGILSKYSIAFPVFSLVVGILALPSQRHHLRSRFFWLGALTMLLVAAPNLIWLIRHHFITLIMEQHIHARDVAMGRAKGYLTDQLKFTLCAFPIAIAGLVWLLRSTRFRLLSAFSIGPLLLFGLAKGRGYYLIPIYISLYAAGAVACERWLTTRRPALRRGIISLAAILLLADSIVFSAAFLPIAHPGSRLWNFQMATSSDLRDEIGWPELVADVASVRDSLSPAERDRLAIVANNYGEAGALALYGPDHNLPIPIAPVNSFQDRGFGPFEPENVIILGDELKSAAPKFESCRVAGHVHIPYNVQNEESVDHPDILFCHHLKGSWQAFWPTNRHFG